MGVARYGMVVGVVFSVLWASPSPESSAMPDIGAATEPALPAYDEFYRPSADLVASAHPGDILAARPIEIASRLRESLGVRAWQLSYRSNNSVDQPIAAVATVLKPRGGIGKLVSLHAAEDSTGQHCAPSYTVQRPAHAGLLDGQLDPLRGAPALLAQGWTVVLPDHQGPDAAFAHGPLAARIALDGIRAAENFGPLRLPGADTEVAMWGYSGGSIPTLHGAEIRAAYAPEVNIVGVVSGGTDVDLEVLAREANKGPGAGLVTAAIIGLAREEPALEAYLRANATPRGREVLAAKDRTCALRHVAIEPFLDIDTLVQGGLLDAPVVREVFDRTRMGKAVPDSPVFLYHAVADWLVPIGPADDLVATYCQDPTARVTYVRDHASEHLTLNSLAERRVVTWLHERFAGIPVENGCTTTNVGSIALGR
ncbi:lipase family protein [Nocardia sp. CNY236]|uniref:lipase family protein n=1 Tax=Nocardia sp. CNY236 TaxID=1169152 RepID=UPI000688F8E6|nr:lipase family protein [Nocardia sp. CNY236]